MTTEPAQSAIIPNRSTMPVPKESQFDYETVAEDKRQWLADCTSAFLAGEQSIYERMCYLGQILENVFIELPGCYQAWVRQELGISIDTASNYRNVFKQMGNLSPEIAGKIDSRAMYILSAPSTSPEARQAAQVQAEQGERVDYKTAFILTKAPARIMERYQAGSLSKDQAFTLIKALLEVDPVVQRVCTEGDVSEPRVVLYLGKAYAERGRRRTWDELQADGFNFRWLTTDGHERLVPLSDANVDTVDRYVEHRRWLHRESALAENAAQWQQRSLSGRIQKTDGGYLITNPTDLPISEDMDGQQVEIIVRWKVKKS